MSVRPKTPADLLLAPVSVEIDLNLQRLRDKPLDQVAYQLQLELNRPPLSNTREQREAQVLDQALRNVELHHWAGTITSDASRLRLTGGSVTLDLGLSPTIRQYIEDGA